MIAGQCEHDRPKGLREEIEAPRRNLCSHRETMQSPHMQHLRSGSYPGSLQHEAATLPGAHCATPFYKSFLQILSTSNQLQWIWQVRWAAGMSWYILRPLARFGIWQFHQAKYGNKAEKILIYFSFSIACCQVKRNLKELIKASFGVIHLFSNPLWGIYSKTFKFF